MTALQSPPPHAGGARVRPAGRRARPDGAARAPRPGRGLLPRAPRAAARPAARAAPSGDRIPFVVVVPSLPVVAVLDAVHMVGGAGFTTMDARRPGAVPAAARARRSRPAPYLLRDVDPGRRRRPAAGRGAAADRRRPPLPADHRRGPACWSPTRACSARATASRCRSRAGDKRVPALWVSGRRPRLGWCDAGRAAHLARDGVVRRSPGGTGPAGLSAVPRCAGEPSTLLRVRAR